MSVSQNIFAFTAFLMSVMTVALIGRLISGPTTADRVLVLDTFNTLVCCIMLLLAALYDSVVMVDVAIVYMAISFVSTLYFARRLEGGI